MYTVYFDPFISMKYVTHIGYYCRPWSAWSMLRCVPLFSQDLISLFQPEIRPDNLRPLALLLELLTVIPEEFSTLLLPSQKRAQVAFLQLIVLERNKSRWLLVIFSLNYSLLCIVNSSSLKSSLLSEYYLVGFL